jgi:CheY-like chemotaxis protein
LKTILVVDDAKLWRDRLKEIILDAGYSVLEADSGEVAVDMVRESRPDLILLDNRMPGMGGLEAARQIRDSAGCETVPIIMLSSEDLPGSSEGTSVHGINSFLDKKDLRNNLLDCIDHYLSDTYYLT